MAKVTNRDNQTNLTSSAIKRSALQRRKEYSARLRTTKTVMSENKSRTTTRIRKSLPKKPVVKNSKNRRSFVDAEPCLPKFRAPLISRQEMEELGCAPVGILANGSLNRSGKHLSFSPQTISFENTASSGTPVKPHSLIEKSDDVRLQELEGILKALQKALSNDEMTAVEVSTDLNGLVLRSPIVQDMFEFWRLKMDCALKSDNIRDACASCIGSIFSTESKNMRNSQFSELKRLLSSVINEMADDQSPIPKPMETTPRTRSERKRTGSPVLSVDQNISQRIITPDFVETTPLVRTGSAAKVLRFTPLIASSQRKSLLLRNVERPHLPTTPLRRSMRLARSEQAS